MSSYFYSHGHGGGNGFIIHHKHTQVYPVKLRQKAPLMFFPDGCRQSLRDKRYLLTADTHGLTRNLRDTAFVPRACCFCSASRPDKISASVRVCLRLIILPKHPYRQHSDRSLAKISLRSVERQVCLNPAGRINVTMSWEVRRKGRCRNRWLLLRDSCNLKFDNVITYCNLNIK